LLWLILSLVIGQACTKHGKEINSGGPSPKNIPAKVDRILSLCPSSTEIIASICPEKLIGRTPYCNFPDFVEQLPVVNNYPLDLEGIIKLHPDLVVTLEGITSQEDIKKIEALGIPVFVQDFRTVDDVLNGIREAGMVCGARLKADLLVDSLEKVKEGLLNQAGDGKCSAINVIWNAPIYVHGYYSLMSDKLRIAGFRNSIDASFKKISPEVSREYLLSMNPDIMFCGFSDYEKEFFDLYPELRRMKCYQNKAIVKISVDLQSRPGPRIMEAVLELKNSFPQCQAE